MYLYYKSSISLIVNEPSLFSILSLEPNDYDIMKASNPHCWISECGRINSIFKGLFKFEKLILRQNMLE